MDYKEGVLEVGTQNLLPLGRKRITRMMQSIHVTSTTEVAPRTCQQIECHAENLAATGEMVAWPVEDLLTKCGVIMPDVLIHAHEGKTSLYVANPGHLPVTLYANSTLAKAQPLCMGAYQLAELNAFQDFTHHEAQSLSQQGTATAPATDFPGLDQFQKMFDLTKADLEGEDMMLLKLFLFKNRDVFAATELDLGRSTAVKFRIDTGGAPPIRQHPYRVPETQKEEVL